MQENGEGARTLRVRLLGGASLVHAGGHSRLERRTAGALAYVALKGEVPREQLYGLLWPASEDNKASANLRQMLTRLRRTAGSELFAEGRVLRLAPHVAVDVLEAQALAEAGGHASLLALEGALLEGHSYEECQDFAAWLVGAREQLEARFRHAAACELDRLEREGALREALALAEQRALCAPANEEACRRLMRLYHLTGDRAAARHAYQRLCTHLHAELAVAPSAATQELARELEKRVERTPTPAARAPLPLSLLRPPSLIEREEAWRALEEGYAQGQLLVLTGERGVGRTRLALDFAETKGAVARLEGRAGDSSTPLAFLTRALRQLLAARPDITLPSWVRRELGRMLPELSPTPPPADGGEGARVRLLEAQGEALRLTTSHLAAVVVDDAQELDEASRDVLLALLSRAAPLGQAGGVAPWLWCVRTEAPAPGLERALQQAQAAGLACTVALSPLSSSGVRALLASLQLPGTEGLALRLVHHAGGNPLLLLETLKHAVETDSLGQPAAPLAVSARARTLVRLRLGGLSAEAQRVAGLAALAEGDFSLELASRLLEVPLPTLLPVLEELEAAQLLREGRLPHALLAQVLREGLPAATRSLLEGRLDAWRAGQRASRPQRLHRQERAIVADRLPRRRGSLPPAAFGPRPPAALA